ncbi:exonuclease [Mycobacterium phage PenguinLover67]|nr:exonuclease [Mycobacterium phage PenguinLover67]
MTSVLDGPRDGRTFRSEIDEPRLNAQARRVFAEMADGAWHTLPELAELTGDPEASISARIRDFRKERFGAMTVIRERIKGGHGLHRYRIDLEGNMPTIAQLYPARTDDNGTTWYRSGGGQQDGWTALAEYAHPSYFEDAAATGSAAPGEPNDPPAVSAPPEAQPQPQESTMTALTDDFEPAPRATQWERFPLPPEPPRPVSKFNGWGWYQLPAPTTGMTTGFPRATTIADTLDDTYGLNRWKRRETAKRIWQLSQAEPDAVIHEATGTTAGEAIEALLKALEAPKVTELDNTLDVIDNLLGGAYSRELGECVHAWAEALDMGIVLLKDVPAIVRPHIDRYRELLANRGLVAIPEYVERTVLNDQGEETVAGKIDRIYRIAATGELVLGDVKTSKDLQYSWLSFGVQVGGVYGWATKCLTLDGKGWEDFPETRRDFAILMHIPSDQPERGAAITIDLMWGGETMVTALETRRRRKEAKVEVPKHAIPAPTEEAIRYASAFTALSAIETLDDGQKVYEYFQDVWDDALGEHAERVAALLDQ